MSNGVDEYHSRILTVDAVREFHVRVAPKLVRWKSAPTFQEARILGINSKQGSKDVETMLKEG